MPSRSERTEGVTTIPKGSRAEVGPKRGASYQHRNTMHERNVRACRLCGIERPTSEFYARKDTGALRSECKECLRFKTSFRSTGWTREAYEAAFVKQHGQCAVCLCTLNSSRYTRLAGDHCHKTGKLRGLLCTQCNTAIGLMKDSPTRLRAAVEYLERHASKNEEIVSSHEQS